MNQVQSHRQPSSKFKVSMGYMRPCLTNKKTKSIKPESVCPQPPLLTSSLYLNQYFA